MSYNLILNSSNVSGNGNNTFKYKFLKGNLDVPEGSLMNISQLTIPYSWYNISSALGNNIIYYNAPSATLTGNQYTLYIPDGFYKTSDLNNYIQSVMKINGHYWYNPTLNGITFGGSFSAPSGNISTLTVTPTNPPTITLSVGQFISFINDVGSNGMCYGTITAIQSHTSYTVSLTGSIPTGALNTVAITASSSNQISIVYPLSISTNLSKYGNQIASTTVPVAANVSSLIGLGYMPADGNFGTTAWNLGYPTTGNECFSISFPPTKYNTNTLGNILGFTSINATTTKYPSTTSGISSTVTSQTVNSNGLTDAVPFPPIGSPVNGCIVRCNLVKNDVNATSDILDTFAITNTFGSNINYYPLSDNWILMKSGRFSELVIQICDQNLNPLPMNDPNILLSILIKFPEK